MSISPKRAALLGLLYFSALQHLYHRNGRLLTSMDTWTALSRITGDREHVQHKHVVTKALTAT